MQCLNLRKMFFFSLWPVEATQPTLESLLLVLNVNDRFSFRNTRRHTFLLKSTYSSVMSEKTEAQGNGVMNDIKRAGTQPWSIHMQMASLALTLINSVWVHSFVVNKDLAACEWGVHWVGQRERERELVASLTVKPPQDIMQPPSCRPNPCRCRTELLQGVRKKETKESSTLFFLILYEQQGPPKPHDQTWWMTRDWASQELHTQRTPWITKGQTAAHRYLYLPTSNIHTQLQPYWLHIYWIRQPH